MGKSNEYVFPWYASHLKRRQYDRVCVLGATGHNDFTQSIIAKQFDFFDLTLGNWKINDFTWNIEQSCYDLVICTRCAYFAAVPELFVRQCVNLLRVGGKALIDWGLGDHWRHKPYRIGWRDVMGDQESVSFDVGGVEHVSTLSSTFWVDGMRRHPAAVKFMEDVQRCEPKYIGRSLTDVIHEEVPSVLSDDHPFTKLHITNVDMLTLWPDAPQLYILTEFTNKPAWPEEV